MSCQVSSLFSVKFADVAIRFYVLKYFNMADRNSKSVTETLDSRWQANYEALKAYVAETGHFPGKHTRLNNWCRYQRKRINAGTLPADRRAMFEELAASRQCLQCKSSTTSEDPAQGKLFCE